ncbi:MAG: complex I NDUFA9 subunit family protein [Planctomycetes bacterium]|nr:complex I NDUFA9 subunit family protein [Planctomycetota bacterium]
MILVTGATGFIGRTLVRRLREHRFKTRAFLRPTSDAARLGGAGVEIAWGDVRDPAAVRAAIDGVTTIVHCVGILLERHGQTFELIHVLGVQRIVDAARAARVKRIILLSVLGARPDARTRFARTRFAGEEIVRNSGIDHTILRLAVVFGAEDHFTNRFASIIRWNPLLPLVGGGRARIQPIHVDDVASAVVYAVLQDRFHNETIDVAGGEAVRLRDAIRAIAGVIGEHVRPFAVPSAAARPAIALAETFLPESPISREMVDLASEDAVCDVSRARDLLGLEPRPLNAAMEHLAAWRR